MFTTNLSDSETDYMFIDVKIEHIPNELYFYIDNKLFYNVEDRGISGFTAYLKNKLLKDCSTGRCYRIIGESNGFCN